MESNGYKHKTTENHQLWIQFYCRSLSLAPSPTNLGCSSKACPLNSCGGLKAQKTVLFWRFESTQSLNTNRYIHVMQSVLNRICWLDTDFSYHNNNLLLASLETYFFWQQKTTTPIKTHNLQAEFTTHGWWRLQLPTKLLLWIMCLPNWMIIDAWRFVHTWQWQHYKTYATISNTINLTNNQPYSGNIAWEKTHHLFNVNESSKTSPPGIQQDVPAWQHDVNLAGALPCWLQLVFTARLRWQTEMCMWTQRLQGHSNKHI